MASGNVHTAVVGSAGVFRPPSGQTWLVRSIIQLSRDTSQSGTSAAHRPKFIFPGGSSDIPNSSGALAAIGFGTTGYADYTGGLTNAIYISVPSGSQARIWVTAVEV